MKLFKYLFLALVVLSASTNCYAQLTKRSSKKIIALSIPKSGTTLLRKALAEITGLPAHSLGRNVRTFDAIDCAATTDKFESHHFVSNFNIILKKYTDQYFKVGIVRDLRDVLISWKHFVQEGHYPVGVAKWKDLSIKESLHHLIDHKVFANYIRNACFWLRDPTVLIVRFEDLVGSQGGGDTDVQIQTIMKIAEHVQMPISKTRARIIAQGLFGGTRTFYKGQIGKWKEHFDDELMLKFKKVYGPEFKALGYSFD